MVCHTSNRNLSQFHHGPIHGLIMARVLTIPRVPLFPQSSPTFSPFFLSLWRLFLLIFLGRMSLERWQNLLVSQFRFEISQWKGANQKGKSIWFYRMLIFGEQCLQKAGLWNGQLSCIGTKEISSVGEQRSFNCADKGKRRGPSESRHLTNSKIIQYLLRISEVWVYFWNIFQHLLSFLQVWVYFWSISNDQKHVNIKVKIYVCIHILVYSW